MRPLFYSALMLVVIVVASLSIKRLDKRQDQLLDAMAKGNMTRFLGSSEATVELEKFAITLGASESEAGSMYDFMRESANPGYGLVPRPENAIPDREELPRRTQTPNSKTIKYRYGPFKVPNSNVKNMAGEMGMLYNYPMNNIPKPCDGKCTITGMTAGLEFLDGLTANINKGLWLHHYLLYNVGEGRSDPTCKDRDVSLPHVIVGTTAKKSERVFGSGNERTPLLFPDASTMKIGYRLNENDKFAILVDLMNTNEEDKTAYLTMTYDIVDGHQKDWDDIKPIWLDIAQCGTSEIIPQQQSGKFSMTSNWTSNVEGEIVGAAGHLHNGGSHLTLSVNGQQTCDSVATYGESPEFIQQQDKSGHAHRSAMKHISSMSQCWGPSFAMNQIKVGQNWQLEAFYDFDKYQGVLSTEDQIKGLQTEVMGISMLYIRRKAKS